MKKDRWIWMPHAGHFIGGSYCWFKLNTYVGKYIVSTVGEWPKDDIDRKCWPADGSNFKNINSTGAYETMVFKASKSDSKCCAYEIIFSEEVDCLQYKTAEEAYQGHLKLCKKWTTPLTK